MNMFNTTPGDRTIYRPPVTTVGDYTMLAADETVFADATAGPLTVTLPSAANVSGKGVRVKKVDDTQNIVTVAGKGTETVDDQVSIETETPNDAVSLESDGSNWQIVSTPTGFPMVRSDDDIFLSVLERDGTGSGLDADRFQNRPVSDFALVEQEAWHNVGDPGEPSYLNAWEKYGVNWAGAGFYKDTMGRVHLRGLVKSGFVQANIFVLPEGYRPAETQMAGVISYSPYAIGRVDIEPSGGVLMAMMNTGFVSLFNISFRAA